MPWPVGVFQLPLYHGTGLSGSRGYMGTLALQWDNNSLRQIELHTRYTSKLLKDCRDGLGRSMGIKHRRRNATNKRTPHRTRSDLARAPEQHIHHYGEEQWRKWAPLPDARGQRKTLEAATLAGDDAFVLIVQSIDQVDRVIWHAEVQENTQHVLLAHARKRNFDIREHHPFRVQGWRKIHLCRLRS